MRYLCNPLNLPYRYQFHADPRQGGKLQICREAADPSLIYFQDQYFLFASMSLGVYVSEDLVHWSYHSLPEELPLYDYAPDVRVLGEWVYFCASKREEKCDRFRTKDILHGPYERIEGSFSFWDPNLFVDDDGRVYFYWGCSNENPIYGVELDPVSMEPLGEKQALIEGHPERIGYERVGEDNAHLPADAATVEARYQAFLAQNKQKEGDIAIQLRGLIRGMFTDRPYIEGAWMDKYEGKYYLQYAAPGTQYNTYSDGVYVGEHPLGPFVLAQNNPYSYQPGGFMPGAGHGSTMCDREGKFWHSSTMRISVNHDFERRIGLWRAGFDAEGELFCNQRYGDWPFCLDQEDPWAKPAWMLLSANKPVLASSFEEGHEPQKASQENVQTWWRAKSKDRKEWLAMDLGAIYQVHAIQINFADDRLQIPVPGEIRPGSQARYIEEASLYVSWLLEGSCDGETWNIIEERLPGQSDLAHDLILREEGLAIRHLRISKICLPYEQIPAISGLRVFGRGDGMLPDEPHYQIERTGDLDLELTIAEQEDAQGYQLLFGSAPDKLYHSVLYHEAGHHRIGALIAGRDYYVRLDVYNENGIREGVCHRL